MRKKLIMNQQRIILRNNDLEKEIQAGLAKLEKITREVAVWKNEKLKGKISNFKNRECTVLAETNNSKPTLYSNR